MGNRAQGNRKVCVNIDDSLLGDTKLRVHHKNIAMTRANDELALNSRADIGDSHELDGDGRSLAEKATSSTSDSTTKRRKFALSKKQRMNWRKQNETRAARRISHTQKFPRNAAQDTGNDPVSGSHNVQNYLFETSYGDSYLRVLFFLGIRWGFAETTRIGFHGQIKQCSVRDFNTGLYCKF